MRCSKDGCAAVVRNQGGLRSRRPGWRHSAPRRGRPSQEQLLLLSSAGAPGHASGQHGRHPWCAWQAQEEPPGNACMQISCSPALYWDLQRALCM